MPGAIELGITALLYPFLRLDLPRRLELLIVYLHVNVYYAPTSYSCPQTFPLLLEDVISSYRPRLKPPIFF